jgi:hypothetical protein
MNDMTNASSPLAAYLCRVLSKETAALSEAAVLLDFFWKRMDGADDGTGAPSELSEGMLQRLLSLEDSRLSLYTPLHQAREKKDVRYRAGRFPDVIGDKVWKEIQDGESKLKSTWYNLQEITVQLFKLMETDEALRAEAYKAMPSYAIDFFRYLTTWDIKNFLTDEESAPPMHIKINLNGTYRPVPATNGTKAE